MRPLDVIAMVAIVVVAIIGRTMYWDGDSGDRPHVRRPNPRQFETPRTQGDLPPLPAASTADPVFKIDVSKLGPGTGTAFSVDPGGRWLTARHVIEGCARVVIGAGGERGVGVSRIVNHPNADLSVLWTNGGAPALALTDKKLRFGQDGFQFGYPKGRPGNVYGELIGRRNMRVTGHYRTSEPIIAWTQRRRVPDYGPDLGGISGGPVLNGGGEVVGVVVAGAPRRGRSYSAAPVSVTEALQHAGLNTAAMAPAGAGNRSIDSGIFPQFGDDLRASLTVAKVFCFTDGRNRARGS